MITFKHKLLVVVMCVLTATTFAQTQKLTKTYPANKDVGIVVDARHTNIVFETWDRNEVQIEAYLDAGIKGDDAKNQLETWKLETRGDASEIYINSGGARPGNMDIDMSSFAESMGHLQNLIAPIMTEMVGPMMESFAKNPPLPPDFADKLGTLNFDFEAYQRDGEKYMKQWEKKIEKNFGKDFEASMEKWAAQFEKNAEIWGDNLEKKMEINGEKFEKSMEKWAENFGAHMEQWGENFAREMENKEGVKQNMHIQRSHINTMKPGTRATRNIRVKMPVGAKLRLDVRHGAVDLGNRVNNLQANLSHSSLKANIIDGQKTEVKVSYTPVQIAQWNYGVLNAGYVQNCVIDRVQSIKLISNSSDVSIGEIGETGILSGNFGALKIQKLNPNFKNLDIRVENSELQLTLPQTALNLNYNGAQSKIEYPKAAGITATTSYDNEMLNGFYKSANSNRNISINSTFSKIIIK